jgi:hypothetical protein
VTQRKGTWDDLGLDQRGRRAYPLRAYTQVAFKRGNTKISLSSQRRERREVGVTLNKPRAPPEPEERPGPSVGAWEYSSTSKHVYHHGGHRIGSCDLIHRNRNLPLSFPSVLCVRSY